MTTIEISTSRIYTTNENQKGDHYDALNASGRGKLVAKVCGPVEVVKWGNADMIALDGQPWTLRDVLAMAQRGERGLSVVEA